MTQRFVKLCLHTSQVYRIIFQENIRTLPVVGKSNQCVEICGNPEGLLTNLQVTDKRKLGKVLAQRIYNYLIIKNQ